MNHQKSHQTLYILNLNHPEIILPILTTHQPTPSILIDQKNYQREKCRIPIGLVLFCFLLTCGWHACTLCVLCQSPGGHKAPRGSWLWHSFAVLSSFIQYCPVLPSITKCYPVLPSITQYCPVLPSIA